jgi:nucleoid-associated protein YgaU
MTREAKIGMLTGLGVIVLIGVLLSEYLGDNKVVGTMAAGIGGPAAAGGSRGTGAGGSTGRMAALPVGAEYRQQVMEPIGVPGMARGDAPVAGGTGTGETFAPVVTAFGPVPAFAEGRAADPVIMAANGPTVTQPVVPVLAGPAPADTAFAAANPPTISGEPAREAPVSLTTPVKAPAGPAAAAKAASASNTPAVSGTTYVIAAGDNLAKIAKKFYNSSKESDVKRIVAANPGVLKDANTPLMVGKKLTIPTVAAVSTASSVPTAAKAAKPTAAPVVAKKAEPGLIQMPGSLDTQTPVEDVVPSKSSALVPVVKKEAVTAGTKSYVVQSGDTLEKIAKKLAPSKAAEYAEKMKALNGVKDPHGLKIGQKLKLPA